MTSFAKTIRIPKLNLRTTMILLTAAGCLGCQSSSPEESTAANVTSPAEPAPVLVTTVPIEIRPVERRVSVVGTLFGFDEVTLTSKVEGRIRSIQHDVGDRIPPGTVLLELDDTDYQLAVDEAQRSLEQHLSKLDLKEPPIGEFDIEQLPSVERTRLLAANARRQFERQQSMLASNATSRQVFDLAETELQVTEAALRQARLDARSDLAAVRHAQAVLATAQQKLSETTVKAPQSSAGAEPAVPTEFVVAKRLASVGEMLRAFPSTPVFELVMDDVLKLKVMVPERYMAQVVQGLKVEVHVEAYPAERFEGHVVRINPTVDPQSRSFEVEAHVPNPSHRLKHGGFAKADVIVEQSDDAIVIPVEAVTRFAGVSKVFRVQDNVVEEVEIGVGQQGSGWVEALGPLRPGDMVVTSGQSQLSNGTRVTVRDQSVTTAMNP
jgi:RND family efflux transporter MFP subunit